VGSCDIPSSTPPSGTCQEYYSAIYTQATIKTVCDGAKGTQSTGGCPTANLLGYCATKSPLFVMYYYGAAGSGAPFMTGCMNGGGTWCPPK
jgi:hypothetical protein